MDTSAHRERYRGQMKDREKVQQQRKARVQEAKVNGPVKRPVQAVSDLLQLDYQTQH